MHQYMYALSLLILVAATYQPPNFTEMKPPSVASGSNMILLHVNGNVYPNRSYTTNIIIGSKYSYTLEIDTGSDLTWLPCVGANDVAYPHYDPGNETGIKVKCSDPECIAPGSNGNCRNRKEECQYNIKYDDGGSSWGALYKDWFHLQYSNGQEVDPHPNIAFGCGYSHSVPYGVLGLGRGDAGILKQLNKTGVIRDIVGHCLSSAGGGFISLGIKNQLPGIFLVWRRLLSGSEGYALGPADLLIHRNKLVVAKGLQINFDSGSIYTHFNSISYGALLGQIQKHLQQHRRRPVHLHKDDKTLPVCWKGPHPFGKISDVDRYFPIIALSFAHNALFHISPKQYLIISDKGNACLGILDGGDMNLIGAISMQDKVVIYDNVNAMVGWGDVSSCPVWP